MKPVLQALLVADHVYDDRETGKKIVAGIFGKLFVKKLTQSAPSEKSNPDQKEAVIQGGMQAGSPYAYVSITEVYGRVNLEFRYIDLKDHNVFFKTGMTISSDDPLQTFEVILPMPSLPAVVGVYALEALADGELLGSHRIIVEALPEENQ